MDRHATGWALRRPRATRTARRRRAQLLPVAALNGLAWTCFGFAAAFAVADWFAVATHRAALEYLCKPAAALAFLVTAIALDPVHANTRIWFCVALVFCMFGDVFLMLPRDAFVAGLASFLVAQLCFTVGFALHIASALQFAIGILLVVVFAGLLTTRYLRALVRDGRGSLLAPVVAYVAAIGAMVATAIGAGGVVGIAGAGLFFLSDALIGETRFVSPRSWGPAAVIVTYHLALGGLVFSLVT